MPEKSDKGIILTADGIEMIIIMSVKKIQKKMRLVQKEASMLE